jgi:hypothetical protein
VARAARAHGVAPRVLYEMPITKQIRSRKCQGCGCHADDRTPGCKRCTTRHAYRLRVGHPAAMTSRYIAPMYCRGCGCDLDSRTRGCTTCKGRFKLRRRADRRRPHTPLKVQDRVAA